MVLFSILFIHGENRLVVLSVQGGLTNVNEPNITRVTREEWAKMKGQTDWERVKSMTEEEIERNAWDDPDSQPLPDEFWDKAEVIYSQENTVVS